MTSLSYTVVSRTRLKYSSVSCGCAVREWSQSTLSYPVSQQWSACTSTVSVLSYADGLWSGWWLHKCMIWDKWVEFPLGTVILAILNWGMLVFAKCLTEVLLCVGAGHSDSLLKKKLLWSGTSLSCTTPNNLLPSQQGHPMDLTTKAGEPGSAWHWATFLFLIPSNLIALLCL